ncbi:preprotein translocase, SecE subunit [Methylobacterium sp. 4-46]|uniref:preprotein translocase subunit SecE n=1 Tax=unclassified Methylobacterium TaxID=2615210 RepID=UPI000152E36A|nr:MULTISPECIES: preprotein translocase subunit SecE [Methylobacterium]ACA14939.1 preprotein translocase, SecE subunit [Methylobacterium sp. 4-46]WFT80676.1 preprotein translocase subunit SecE [Methylobacterium nodulans]
MASNEATKKVDLGRNATRGTPVPRGAGPTPPPVRPAPKRVGPFEFLQQVRDEGRKVTWPTRKETLITTLMVFVMVVLASLFFVVVDQVLRYLVTLVLGIGA